MARPATGAPRWDPRQKTWEARITLPGVGRVHKALPGVPACLKGPTAPPAGCKCTSCTLARQVAKGVSDAARSGGMVPAGTSTTVSEWYARYYDAAALGSVGKKNRGRPQTSIEARRSRFDTWIEPLLGPIPIVNVTPADLRRVVQKLDDAVRIRGSFYDAEAAEDSADQRRGRKPGLSAKTAQNVWSEVTNGFAEAVNSKTESLRVLTVNPVRLGSVQPPTSGEDREQAALFPAEVVQLLSCPAVPLARRRCYAVAIYTGMRRSELARLTAQDVDLEHETIKVRGRKTTAAKRTIPIHPALRPLLKVLIAEKPEGALLPVPRADGKGGAADLVRKDLVRAGLTRADLTRDDAEHMPFTFHGLRHTCITHWTVAGRDQLFLLTAGGHTDVDMTKRYLAAASSLSAKFGVPHPPIPAELVGPEPEGFWSGIGFLGEEDKSKTGNPEGLPVVLTVAWRPQWELNAASTHHEPPVFMGSREPANGCEPTKVTEPSGITPPEPKPFDAASDPDDALRTAIKASLDAGDYDRVRALVVVLESAPKPAPILTLADRRRRE